MCSSNICKRIWATSEYVSTPVFNTATCWLSKDKVIDSKTSEIAPYKEQSNYRWGLFFWGKEINNINKVGLEGWFYEIEYAKNFVNTRINNHDEFKEENGNQNERNFLDAIYESLY